MDVTLANIDPALGPIHPGEILLEEFLLPMGITQYRLAKAIHVDPRRINEVVHGKRGISADTALRLGLFFGVEPQMWMNLQARYDLELAAQQQGVSIEQQVIPWRATGT